MLILSWSFGIIGGLITPTFFSMLSWSVSVNGDLTYLYCLSASQRSHRNSVDSISSHK